MSAVWKYELLPGANELRMPRDARIVSVGVRDLSVVLWAWVTPELESTTRRVRAVATGEVFDSTELCFIGTVSIVYREGTLVFHVFEEPV